MKNLVTRCSAALLLGTMACAQVQAAPQVTGPSTSLLSHQGASTLEAKLSEGRLAIAKRDFARADALFKEAIAMDRKSPLPLLSLAESARVRNDPTAARQWLTEALKVAPQHPPTLRAWALWHYSAAEYVKAVEFWQAALRADPRFAGVLVDLGDYHFNVLDKPEIARNYYQRALDIDPNLAGAQYALGMALVRAGDEDGALKRFTESARLSPANALPLVAMGQVYARKNDSVRALALYDQALVAQPGYYPARLEKADLWMASGKTQLALDEYRSVAKLYPKVVAAHVGVGVAAQSLEQPKVALASYQAALALQPDHLQSLNNAAWLASENGGVADGGLAWARKAASLAPNEALVQGTLGWVLHKRGDTDQAIQHLDRLIKGVGRKQAESHYLLGRVLADNGETQRAMTELKEALGLNPSFGQAADATARLQKLGKN